MPIQLSLIILINLLIFSIYVRADVILDGTLGRSGLLPGPDFAIGAELGQQHGGNLFHSFSQFNLQQQESATFSGPASVNHIISRVTGGTASTINGRLRSSISNADFYLINPAGILFGEQTQLDVQGSFYVSTADYLRLGDGGRFHATQPETSLLTVAPPSAFGFMGARYAPITLQDSELRVPDNATFSLVAGDISLTNSGIYAPDGQVHLTSVASQGEVSVNPNPVNMDRFQTLGQINLVHSTLGNKVSGFEADETHWNGSQRIYIRGGQFFSDNSLLNAKALQERSGEGDGIVINNRQDMRLTNTTLLTDSFTNRNAGDITIRTHDLTMHNSTVLSSNTQNRGAAGVITIEAKQLIMKDNAIISSDTSQQGGPGGRILISADGFQMQGDTLLNATTNHTDSPAGDIMIKITGDFQMAGDATINTGAFSDGRGNGGTVTIEAKTLSLTDTAKIISTSFTRGQSGSLHIVADQLTLSNQSAIAATTFSQGQGGDVNVQVRDIFSLTDDAVILSGTEGRGSGGEVILLIQADRVAIGNAANISSASGMENAFIQEIARLVAIAKQQGAEINDTVFVGGGEQGQVHIKTDKLFLNEKLVNRLAERWPFKHCDVPPKTELSLTVETRRQGLSEMIQDEIFLRQ